MQRYGIVQGNTLDQLVKVTNDMLEQGWRVTGGPMFTGRAFVQAIVRELSEATAPASMPAFHSAELTAGRSYEASQRH